MKELLAAIENLKTREEISDFLLGILTPKEIDEISRRLKIVRMLKKGIQHKVIAERLGVGVATVTRGSKELQKGRLQHV